MAKVWITFFMSGLLSSSSQYIYQSENNDCRNTEETMEQFRTILAELRRFKLDNDQQLEDSRKIKDLLTNLSLMSKLQPESDDQLRLDNIEIKDVLTNLTLLSKLQRELEQLQQDNTEMKDVLTNLTLTSKLQRASDDQLRLDIIEIKDLLTNLTITSKLQLELDHLQQDSIEIKDVLTNLTLTSKLQRASDDQLRLDNIEIKDLLTNLTVTSKLQRELDHLQQDSIEIKHLLTNLTLTSKRQRESDDQLRLGNMKIEDLLNNLTLTVKLQRESDDQLRRGNKEIRDLLTKLTITSLKLNKDCKDLYLPGYLQTGVYRVNPFGNESQINVYCDMGTEGGGWTAIQKRVSGLVKFNKTWVEYKTGFGNANDSYSIGNDVIHQLTKGRNSSLFVSIKLRNGTKLYEIYDQFFISDEADNYKLFLGGPATGTLGDSMRRYDLSRMSFSSPDRDNDNWNGGNCADIYGGGWWFKWCHLAFLNGPWSPESWTYPWYPEVTNGSDVMETFMMIKPH